MLLPELYDTTLSARDARLLSRMWYISSACRPVTSTSDVPPEVSHSCVCSFHRQLPSKAEPAVSGWAARSASQQVFAIPDLVEIIVGHLNNDAQSLLTLLYVNSATRSLATSALHEPASHQRVRELIIRSISRYQMPCLRRILSPLVALGPDRPHYLSGYSTEDDYSLIDPQLHAQTVMSPARARANITIPLPSCLFAKIFHFIPNVRRIRKAVLKRDPLAWSAVVLLNETPRIYPGKYENDNDVLFSLACRQYETSDQVRLLLTRDRAKPERAALRTGRSPLADLVEARLAQYPIPLDRYPPDYSHCWLPSDVTWLMIRGYRLRASDVDVIRQSERPDLWAGLMRWAVGFDRAEEEALLLRNATPAERTLARRIRHENDRDLMHDRENTEWRQRRAQGKPTPDYRPRRRSLHQSLRVAMLDVKHRCVPRWSWELKFRYNEAKLSWGLGGLKPL